MRTRILLLGLLTLPASLAATPGAAQVSVDMKALDAIPAGPPAVTAPAPAAKPKPAAHRPKAARQAKTTPAKPASQAVAVKTPPPPAATLPTAPPPLADLPPPAPPVLPHASAPPQPPAIALDAGGAAAPIANGLRVTFAPARSEITPQTEQTLSTFARALPASDPRPFNVLAYAAGTAEDPSTPRRLSLSRALTARNVLLAAGIPSTRIYVRALGAHGADGPADRVDVVLGGVAIPPPHPGPGGTQGGAP